MFDVLIRELVDLNTHLQSHGIPLILGGGMGLYLRDTSLEHFGVRSPRYPQRPESRSTEDLDVLLSAGVIVDADKMASVRDVIRDQLNYDVEVPHFQFTRDIGSNGTTRTVGIDLLAAPPPPDRAEDVKEKAPRVRPHHVSDIHGRLTPEAAGIEIGLIPIELGDLVEVSPQTASEVHIPSGFNYLILKLHAFHDRKDQPDDKSDRGRHHAFDIFRIVTDMREEDWDTAGKHVCLEGDEEYLREAARYQHNYFSQETDTGVIRLKENSAYQRHRDEFDRYIPDFIGDLQDLFDGVSPGGRQ